VAGFGGAGVAFGGELAGGSFEGGDAGDQLGPVGSFDFGAELEAEPGAEGVVFGAEPADLVAGDGQVGAQAGLGDRLPAMGRGGGSGLALGLAVAGGLDVLADAVGVAGTPVTPTAVATAAGVSTWLAAASRAFTAVRARWRLSWLALARAASMAWARLGAVMLSPSRGR
jgi:hypothetical protein